jgi:hypothetical protein
MVSHSVSFNLIKVEIALREAIIKESIETITGVIEKGMYNPQNPIDLVN